MTNQLVPFSQHQDVNQTLALGEVLARSGYFADAREAAQAVVKVLAGRELGIGPIASMTGVNIIKGRVTLSANLIAVRRSPRNDYRVKHLDDQGCDIEFTMDNKPIGNSIFTMDDARRAGLASGDNWRKFPRNMLFARALSNGAKWYSPDVFGGPVYTADELDPKARIDPETGELLSSTPINEAEIVKAETASPADGLHIQVTALVEETGTDLPKCLAHYGIGEIKDLDPSQCAEAIKVLTVRKNANTVFFHTKEV